MSAREDFWSRRKARVAKEEAAEVEAVEAAKLAEDHAALEEKSDEEILQDLGLPDPDALEKGDDFKAFMAKAVPDRIRRRALRKLWTSNPALANLDGLIDYGEDFTDKAKVIENLQTAYQVGKGMLAHVEELARQEEEKARAEDPETEIAMAEEASPDEGEAAEDMAAFESEAEEAPEDEVVMTDAPVDSRVMDGATETLPAPRRRMRFAFDEQVGGAA